MSRLIVQRSLLAAVAVGWMLSPDSAMACAACFGKSDSALAKGMNMGIFSLLGTIGLVLSGVAAFFIFLVRKGAQVNGAPTARELPETVTRT